LNDKRQKNRELREEKGRRLKKIQKDCEEIKKGFTFAAAFDSGN